MRDLPENIPFLVRTTLSRKGQILIPKKIRELGGFRAGDSFSVSIEEDAIVLRRDRPCNRLVEVLLACPVKSLVTPRRRMGLARMVDV